MVKALSNEVQKKGLAPQSMFVLLEWTTQVMKQIPHQTTYLDKYYEKVLGSVAHLLNLHMASEHMRRPLKVNAERLFDAAISTMFHTCSDQGTRENIVKTTINKLAVGGSSSQKDNAVALGLFIRATSNMEDIGKAIQQNYEKSIYSYYVKDIVGSRTIVPAYLANALKPFFFAYTTLETFQSELVAPIERALLRSPEVLLHNLLSELVSSLKSEIDLSSIVLNNLLKHLLTSVKSSNPSIRSDALSTFKTLAIRCHNEEQSLQIAEQLTTALKTKGTSGEQRLIYAEMLLAVPLNESLSTKLPSGIITVIKQESNENVIFTLLSSLLNLVGYRLRGNLDIKDNAVNTEITNGLRDKRISIRRAWISKVGHVLSDDSIDSSSESTQTFIKLVVNDLLATYTEVISNPIAAVQSGLITAGYVFATLSLKGIFKGVEKVPKSSSVLDECLAEEPKPSFLVGPKVYTKLVLDDDHEWLLDTLCAVMLAANESQVPSTSWALGYLYMLNASNISHTNRRKAKTLLSSLYQQKQAELSNAVIKGIWSWLSQLETSQRDSPAIYAKSGAANIVTAIQAITVPASTDAQESKSILERQLVGLVVPSHHPLLIHDVHWIHVCQKVDIDPGELAKRYSDDLFQEIITYSSASAETSPTRSAALNAGATLSFVNPDVFTPLLVEQFSKDLNSKNLASIDEQKVAIWKAESGVAYIDVLAKSAPVTTLKNTKDYKTLQWEAEVRDQLAKKKGAARKLTPDEQAKVNDQIEKETRIRADVEAAALVLRRGLGIIGSLAQGINNRVELWLGKALEILLLDLQKGIGYVVGSEATEIYMASAKHVSNRLGPIRQFVGLATLRACNIDVPQSNEIVQEDTAALVTRVLYRVRSVAEQRPLDTISLIYTLPLILKVITNGGIGQLDSEAAEEQVVLALEFLAQHTESCKYR